MKIRQIKLSHIGVAFLMSLLMAFSAPADEKIIKQEKISFEKCVKVIKTSKDRLSMSPTITDFSNQKRVAVFTLLDGTLTITCDRESGSITVATNLN